MARGLLLCALAAACAWLLLRGGAPTLAPGTAGAPVERRGAPRSDETRPPGLAPAAPNDEGSRPTDGERPSATRAEPRTLSGRVEDESGLGLPDVEVALHGIEVGARPGAALADGVPFARTRSTDTGSFSLPAPSVWPARLSAQAPGRGRVVRSVEPDASPYVLRLRTEARLAVRAVHGTGRALEAGEVEVRVALQVHAAPLVQGRAAFVGLPAGPASVSVRGAAGEFGDVAPVELLAGTSGLALVVVEPGTLVLVNVRDEATDDPLPGALVTLARPGRATALGSTGADGTLGPLPAGRQGERTHLSVAADGYVEVLQPLRLNDPGGAAQEIWVNLRPAETWQGHVHDAEGRPVAGATVGYTPQGVLGRPPAQALTDEAGRFRLPPPPPPAPGRRVMLVAQGTAGRAALALRPDQEAPAGLVLRLVAGAMLSGRVVDASGLGVADVAVRLQPVLEAPAADSSGDLLRAQNIERPVGLLARSAADGRWWLDDVPYGRWRALLEHEGRTQGVNDVVDVAARNLRLPPWPWGAGLALDGLLLDDAGRGVPGARVRTLDPAGGLPGSSALCDAQGHFRLTGLSPGDWTLETSDHVGARLRSPVRLPREAPVELRLPAPAILRLEVWSAGTPYGGPLRLTLRAEGDAGLAARELHVELEEGIAPELALPAGRWRLDARVRDEFIAGEEALLDVEAGRSASLRLQLETCATLQGLVLDARGLPVRGARVRVQATGPAHATRARGAPEQEVTSAADGTFSVRGLRSGPHVVRAAGSAGAPRTENVVLAAGERLVRTLRLENAGSVAIRALDARGRPVVGALLAVKPLSGDLERPPRPPRTDRKGRAQWPDVPLGPALVSVRAADGTRASARVEVRAGVPVDLDLTLEAPAPR